ncbi:hypothetical protein GCM10017673_14490 [Streptosporangium violaceochromogenes]|nr:hypothetical protein GCM10017673_14490 [Streptosporangium violaceochromogenes]
MTSEGKRDVLAPPGRAFWQEAERKRNALGWTKTAMTRRAGVARKTYDRLFDQPRKPLPETINKIADALGIPRPDAYALSGLDPNSVPTEKAETGSEKEFVEEDPYISQLEELLAQMPENSRRRLEEAHIRERERYQRKVAEAREDYERALSDLEEIIREVIHPDREP